MSGINRVSKEVMLHIKLNLIVLRSNQPKDLAFWYEELLEQPFIEEKHGNGPTHYSIQLCDSVLEVYPRNHNNHSVKVTFGIITDSTIFDKISKKAKKCRMLDDNTLIVVDPEDNKVIVQAVD